MYIFRKVSSLVKEGLFLIANAIYYNLGKEKLKNENIIVYFQDGVVSYNTGAELSICSDENGEDYGMLINTTEAKKIIDKFSLQNKDIFYGRELNYILIKDSNNNLIIKSNTINIDGDLIIDGNLNINGNLNITGNAKINNKDIAVVGGDVNINTGKIIGSGQ